MNVKKLKDGLEPDKEPDKIELYRDEITDNIYMLIVASQQVLLIHYVREVDKLPLNTKKISQ